MPTALRPGGSNLSGRLCISGACSSSARLGLMASGLAEQWVGVKLSLPLQLTVKITPSPGLFV